MAYKVYGVELVEPSNDNKNWRVRKEELGKRADSYRAFVMMNRAYRERLNGFSVFSAESDSKCNEQERFKGYYKDVEKVGLIYFLEKNAIDQEGILFVNCYDASKNEFVSLPFDSYMRNPDATILDSEYATTNCIMLNDGRWLVSLGLQPKIVIRHAPRPYKNSFV